MTPDHYNRLLQLALAGDVEACLAVEREDRRAGRAVVGVWSEVEGYATKRHRLGDGYGYGYAGRVGCGFGNSYGDGYGDGYGGDSYNRG